MIVVTRPKYPECADGCNSAAVYRQISPLLQISARVRASSTLLAAVEHAAIAELSLLNLVLCTNYYPDSQHRSSVICRPHDPTGVAQSSRSCRPDGWRPLQGVGGTV